MNEFIYQNTLDYDAQNCGFEEKHVKVCLGLFCHLVLAVAQLKGRRMNKSESFESVDYRGTNLYEEHQDKVIKVLIFTASKW